MSVTELNSQVSSLLERHFGEVWLEGEIQNFSEPSSGHWYFSLHDGNSQIRAACFRGTNWKIRFKPMDGVQVRVRGKLSVYAARGEYQIIVSSLSPVGDGALKLAFEQIRAKLEAEGLFDEGRKRPLPEFPKRIGVVTSPTGAAIFDILNVISRRRAAVDVVLVPSMVQGDGAPETIVSAIRLANEFNLKASEENKLDVLIVGRGGGSAEDLAAFNEEGLAREIFSSEIPVISAVGHQIDYSISDYVADLRAETPSAAAEIVARRESELRDLIVQTEQRSVRLIESRIEKSRRALDGLRASDGFRDFPLLISGLKEQIAGFEKSIAERIGDALSAIRRKSESLTAKLSPVRLANEVNAKKLRLGLLVERNQRGVKGVLGAKSEGLGIAAAKLNAISPLVVLERGYSIARGADGRVVRDAASLTVGDDVEVRVLKGNFSARVTDIESE